MLGDNESGRLPIALWESEKDNVNIRQLHSLPQLPIPSLFCTRASRHRRSKVVWDSGGSGGDDVCSQNHAVRWISCEEGNARALGNTGYGTQLRTVDFTFSQRWCKGWAQLYCQRSHWYVPANKTFLDETKWLNMKLTEPDSSGGRPYGDVTWQCGPVWPLCTRARRMLVTVEWGFLLLLSVLTPHWPSGEQKKRNKRQHWSHETNPVLEIWSKNPITWNSSDSLIRERPKCKWLHWEGLKDWTHFQTQKKKQTLEQGISFFWAAAFCLHQQFQTLL